MNCWNPVYSTGCGWRDCPECGPLIELEIEAEHLAVVQKTYPGRAVVSEWLGDIYGTGQERLNELKEERKTVRCSQAKVREERRVKRVFTTEQTQQASELLTKRSKRLRGFSHVKSEWLAEVWLELLNPTRLVSRREAKLVLERRVRRAINRAQDNLQRRWDDENRFIFNGLRGEIL